MNRFRRSVAVAVLAILPALPVAAQQSETDDLVVQPVDAAMSGAYIMRHRPFVLPDHPTPAFDFENISTEPITGDDARAALQRFLELRNLTEDRIEAAVSRFDDPALVQIIPAANLRAALLMLSDWDPYQATIDAILDGKNESGHPFEAVDFRPLEFGAAVATLQVAYSTGQPRLLVSNRYTNESPEQLIPVLVHESMHDGVENSYEEEIIASVLDSLTYAEVLSVDPDAANTGTELAAYNNVQLFALMNSIGRRGAGYVGLETSFDGDVYLGAGLESFDADSIRAGIASDPWYGTLPRGGSQGGAVLTALLGRFPESAELVSLDRFSVEAIAAIDRGIGLVLTPRKVRALAIGLQLSVVTGQTISYEPGAAAPSLDNLIDRPYLPAHGALFDLRAMNPGVKPMDEEFARAALREGLLRTGLSSIDVTAAVASFDDPAIRELVSDPTLRAGLLLLHRNERWASILASVIDGANGDGVPVHIAFRDLPDAVPAAWESQGWKGAPAIWIDSMLLGERPELLAAAIAEGALLESADRSPAQTIIAAALSTVLWADLVTTDPTLPSSATWGVITRNRDLLALLNAQPFDPGTPAGNRIGLRLATGDGDVLPGLLMDPGSFVDYILESPRAVADHPPDSGSAPSALTELLRRAGIDRGTAQPARIDDELLAQIDLDFFRLLPDGAAVDAANALGLTVSGPSA
ncbi:MAG TPA: hypothetical protein VFP05_19595 [Thermomicrobiales bacterium]|nr:hypothetical protein [Thermomicrobiales bacterium]